VVGSGRENNQREGGGAIDHKAGSKIPIGLIVSPVYKQVLNTSKTTFRMWCLYSYLFHASLFLLSWIQVPEIKWSRCEVRSWLNNISQFIKNTDFLKSKVRFKRKQKLFAS
jgi:hypothetical protein